MGRKLMIEPEVPALEAVNLTRRWPGGPPVFSGLTLSVNRGEICCLLGPSGCGKSTFLRCAASLDPIETGKIVINGVNEFRPSPRRQLILQDDRQLLPWLNVEENISFPIRMGRAAIDTLYDTNALLDLVGMNGTGDKFPAQLSGGMKQRVVLARALAAEPKILLLDEPFAALDSEIRRRLQAVIKRIHQSSQLTIILVTHDISEALILADTIIYMNIRGELSSPESNPLDSNRNPESMRFFSEMNRMRRRYETLVDSIDL